MTRPTQSQCEMCGKATQLTKAIIEGVSMKVCENCARHGRVVVPDAPRGKSTFTTSRSSVPGMRPTPRVPMSMTQTDDEFEYILTNAGALIKAKRESMGLRQIDLSKKLNIKESIIHQIEAGHAKPTIDIIKKFESSLGLKLMGKTKASSLMPNERMAGSAGFTLGDFVKK